MTDVQIANEMSVDGRQVVLLDRGESQFWDDDMHLFNVPHRVSAQQAEMYLQVYDKGREHGENYGRVKLQYDMQRLLGVTP